MSWSCWAPPALARSWPDGPVVTGGVIKSPHRLPSCSAFCCPSPFGPFFPIRLTFYFPSFLFRGDVGIYFKIPDVLFVPFQLFPLASFHLGSFFFLPLTFRPFVLGLHPIPPLDRRLPFPPTFPTATLSIRRLFRQPSFLPWTNKNIISYAIVYGGG